MESPPLLSASTARRSLLGAPEVLEGPHCPSPAQPLPVVPPFPRQHLRELHEVVVSRMVGEFWGDHGAASALHRLPMEYFVRRQVPANRFVERHLSWVRRHPEEDVLPRALADLLRRSSNAIDIYLRREVEPDFTLPFLEATEDFEESSRIAWIEIELSEHDFQELTSCFRRFPANERLFLFCSPAFSWENGFGRRGILVLRHDRIVADIPLQAS